MPKLTVRSRAYGKQHTQEFSGSYYAKSRMYGNEWEFMHIEFEAGKTHNKYSIKRLVLDQDNCADLRYECEMRTTLSEKAEEVLFQLHKPNFKKSWDAITQEEWREVINETLLLIKNQNNKAPF